MLIFKTVYSVVQSELFSCSSVWDTIRELCSVERTCTIAKHRTNYRRLDTVCLCPLGSWPFDFKT